MLTLLISLILTLQAAPVLVEAGPAAVDSEAGHDRQPEAESGLNVSELIFSHIGDSYSWHIATVGDRHIELYLPVIAHTSDGRWHLFSSSRLAHGHEHEGLMIAPPGHSYEGKLIQSDGTRPLDISVTKNVLSLLFSAMLIAVLVLSAARFYRRDDASQKAPRGIAALLEPLVLMVHDIARENIGEDYRRYSPYLCTAFFFILVNNLMGIVPFFPGGANLTGNIAVTMSLSLFTFLAINLFGNRHYYKDILWPDVPVFLKAIPVMPIIETFSALMKPVSLTIRLFANMLAGHIIALSLVCVIFIVAKYGALLFGSLSVVMVLFGVFMDVLELLVAFIQAYVFTILSAIFIGLSRQKA